MTVHWKGIRKEAVEVYFEISFPYISEGTEEKHEKSRCG
jgi:hypothetical protein